MTPPTTPPAQPQGSATSADVYQAIADPTRRALLSRLASARELPVAALSRDLPLPMTASAVSQHLKVLRDAGLVAVRKAGRERLYRLNADPLREVAEWASTYERFWTERMDRLGTYLEKKAAPPNPSPGRQEQEQKTP